MNQLHSTYCALSTTVRENCLNELIVTSLYELDIVILILDIPKSKFLDVLSKLI